MKLLKHHPGFAADVTLIGMRIRNMFSCDQQRPARYLFKLIDTAQKRGFAGAGRADNYYHLTSFDL